MARPPRPATRAIPPRLLFLFLLLPATVIYRRAQTRASASSPVVAAAAATAAAVPKPPTMDRSPDDPRGPTAPLTIAVVGFGTFGQFLAARFARRGHRVVATSRKNYARRARDIGAEFYPSADAMLDTAPDVVVLCTSIVSLHKVLAHFPLQRLSGKLVVDVLSVKLYPRQLLRKVLPADAGILCTHPMFGPVSGANSWHNLPFMHEDVRVPAPLRRAADAYVAIFRDEGCKMVTMTAEQHDADAAASQFLTHTTGRVLEDMQIHNTSINTAGFESLLGVVDSSTKDSFDLFYGLYKYNPLARAQLRSMERALRHVREQLEAAERAEADSKSSTAKGGGGDSLQQAADDVLRELSSRSAATQKPNEELFLNAVGMTFLRRLAQKAPPKSERGEPQVLDTNL